MIEILDSKCYSNAMLIGYKWWIYAWEYISTMIRDMTQNIGGVLVNTWQDSGIDSGTKTF